MKNFAHRQRWNCDIAWFLLINNGKVSSGGFWMPTLHEECLIWIIVCVNNVEMKNELGVDTSKRLDDFNGFWGLKKFNHVV